MDDTNVTTEQAISWLEKRLEQRPTPGERVVFSVALSSMRTQQEKKPCGWISVKDRLPDKNQQCLCRYVFIYDDGKESEQGFYRVLWFFASDQNQHFQDEGSFGMRVTHWMPLPEPPKEE